ESLVLVSLILSAKSHLEYGRVVGERMTSNGGHCFTRYIEFHRCVASKGEEAGECEKFAKYYRSLCPGEWVDKWNEQRENGTFAGPF
ncbi:hypothetical protein MKX01_009419, partial [Papaver californicum]